MIKLGLSDEAILVFVCGVEGKFNSLSDHWLEGGTIVLGQDCSALTGRNHGAGKADGCECSNDGYGSNDEVFLLVSLSSRLV